MKPYLLIDTASPTLRVALFDKETGTFLADKKITSARRADTTLSAIQSILGETDYTPEDLAGIVVRGGQGSYTGLRVGVSIANALAWSLKLPINRVILPYDEEIKPEDITSSISEMQVSTAWPTIVPEYTPWQARPSSGTMDSNT